MNGYVPLKPGGNVVMRIETHMYGQHNNDLNINKKDVTPKIRKRGQRNYNDRRHATLT